MAIKLLLLDLDGTVREPISGNTFIQHPKDQKIIEGAGEAIEYAHSVGWIIAGITNQGGVIAGYKSLQEAIDEQIYTLFLLPKLNSIYFCPDYDGEICWKVKINCSTEILQGNSDPFTFRKPSPGMLLKAIHDFFGYVPEQKDFILYVGDRDEDRLAADSIKVDFFWADIWRSKYWEIL